MNWGEAYLDHYEKYLGQPIGREVFRGNPGEPDIQVLAYEKVFPECMVFATLGLTKAASQLEGRISEVVLPVDDGLLAAARILANALYFIMRNGLLVERGTLVGGVKAIDPKFALAFGKSALYFTTCQGLPDAFSTVMAGGARGDMVMAIFLTPAEEALKKAEGFQRLEACLEAANVDPFSLRRSSAV